MEGRSVRDYTSHVLPNKLPNLIGELCFLGFRPQTLNSAKRPSYHILMHIFMQPMYLNKMFVESSQLLLIIGKKILSQCLNPLRKNTRLK